MAPNLEKCFTMRAYLGKSDTVTLETPDSPTKKVILPLESGWIQGSGLKAELMPGGSDWNTMNPALKTAHVNVRTQARIPSSGHGIYMHYVGILHLDDAATNVLTYSPSAKTTQYSDHTWFSQPRIETSDPAFKWVESSMFVGEGRFIVDEKGTAVEYEIYKVIK